MKNREYYDKKLEVISAIEDNQIKTPTHIPVSAYIQEANTLYLWAQEDKEPLTAAGLSWDLAADIPIRLGALVEAEARWQTQWNSRTKGSK